MSSHLNIKQRVPRSDNPDTSSPRASFLRKNQNAHLFLVGSVVFFPRTSLSKEQSQLVTLTLASAGPTCGQGRLSNGHFHGGFTGTDVPVGSVTTLRALKI